MGAAGPATPAAQAARLAAVRRDAAHRQRHLLRAPQRLHLALTAARVQPMADGLLLLTSGNGGSTAPGPTSIGSCASWPRCTPAGIPPPAAPSSTARWARLCWEAFV